MRSKHTRWCRRKWNTSVSRSEEHTSELQSQSHLVCRLLLEKKKNYQSNIQPRHRQHDQLPYSNYHHLYYHFSYLQYRAILHSLSNLDTILHIEERVSSIHHC